MLINWKQVNDIDQKKIFVNTANPHHLLQRIKHHLSNESTNPFVCNYLYIGSVYFMFSDPKFYKSITNANSVHLDGFAIGRVAKLLYKSDFRDFTPSDFLYDVFNYCQLKKKRVFIVGSYPGEKGIAQAIYKVKQDFNLLNVGGVSGFFKDNDKVVKEVNTFKPDVLVVGLGLQKQEVWIDKNRHLLKSKIIISVGNYIDILAGRVKDPLAIYKIMHIRWLRRMVKEPKRLWKRYLGGIFYLSLIGLSHYLHKFKK